MTRTLSIAAVFLCLGWSLAAAQGAQVAFGGLQHDASQPVEISADSLAVNQGAATAEFNGNVVAGQASLRISADRILVEYRTEEGQTGKVHKLSAFGNVTLVNGAEAAEAAEAVYLVTDGTVRMAGEVLLTQGQNAISGEVLNIDLNSGNAVFEGRVKTIFQATGN